MVSNIHDLERYNGKMMVVKSSVFDGIDEDHITGHLKGITKFDGVNYLDIECNGDGKRSLTYHVPIFSTHSAIHRVYVDGIGWVYESNGNGASEDNESQILLIVSNNSPDSYK